MMLKKNLKQRDFEKFEELFWADENEAAKGIQRRAGVLVRAAIGAGWIEGLTVEEFAEYLPKQARELGKEVDALYGEIASIDPNS